MIIKDRPGINRQPNKRHLVLYVTLFILFMGSLTAIVFGIHIYRETMVAPRQLALPVILGAIGVLPLIFFFAKNFLNTFYMVFLAAAIGGGDAYFLTLYLNKQFAAAETTSANFDIKRTGHLAKRTKRNCGLPFIMIDFEGLEKQLFFDCRYEHRIKFYKKVKLSYSEGYFGYPVIIGKSLPGY